jgi:PAS domain S-box-containing protein
MRQDGTFAYLNDLALDRWGYTAEEASRIRVPDVDPIFNEDVFNAAFAQAQAGEALSVETLHRKKDGTIYPVEVNMGGLEISRKPHMFAVARDITERKKSEEALRESEARLRSVIAAAPAGIGLFIGRDLVVEMPNQTFIDIVGKGPDIVGKPLREVMPELVSENQPFLQILDDVYTSGKMFHSFGSQVSIVQQGVMTHNFYNITYTPLFDSDGAVYAILDIAIDVTEQMMARREIEASQQRFRTLLEAIPPMTWTNTPVGDVDFYNQRWYDYTGLNHERIRDLSWEALVHPADLPRTLANYRQALETGQDLIVENRYRRADGDYRWHLNRALPIRNEAGEITQWVGTATDIHKQKELEAELEQQVQLRTQQLQTSVQDLQRSNQNLQQFAYVASHDLQEPLRKIQSFGDLLKSQYANQLSEGIDHLQRMQSAASRMSVLIKDLLMFSRISTQQDATSPVSLTTVIDDVLSDLDVVITETVARVTIEPLPTVQGDGSQLGQLFQNLLSNALKFRRPNTTPTIQVTARRVAVADLPPTVRPTRMAAEYHRIEVTDDGIGFDDKYVDRIFQVFQRLHGRNEYVGTGIGLAICEKVAANHGGAITATSQPGQGATFRVYLPVLE